MWNSIPSIKECSDNICFWKSHRTQPLSKNMYQKKKKKRNSKNPIFMYDGLYLMISTFTGTAFGELEILLVKNS